ncbi:hypothetical protein ABKN59_011949 [Abortiporus biennis]
MANVGEKIMKCPRFGVSDRNIGSVPVGLKFSCGLPGGSTSATSEVLNNKVTVGLGRHDYAFKLQLAR